MNQHYCKGCKQFFESPVKRKRVCPSCKHRDLINILSDEHMRWALMHRDHPWEFRLHFWADVFQYAFNLPKW